MMSGTSWFDLSSIQDQINKSIQEATKLAEDASKYDILNFDAMAKQEAEEDERDYDSGDEQDTVSNSKSLTTAVIHSNDHYGWKDAKKFDALVRDALDIDGSGIEADTQENTDSSLSYLEELQSKPSSTPETQSAAGSTLGNNFDTKRSNHSVYQRVNESSLYLPSSSSPFPSYADVDLHGEDSEDLCNRRSLSPGHENDIVSASLTPPFDSAIKSASDSEDRDNSTEWDHTISNRVISFSTTTSKLRMTPHDNQEFKSTPTKTDSVVEDVGDDFFGDQFNCINTIKKDKLPRSSSYVSDTQESSSFMNNKSSIKIQKAEYSNNDNNQTDSLLSSTTRFSHKERDSPVLSSTTSSTNITTVPHVERKKKKKKERKKGSLDFFGMSSTVASVGPVNVSSTGGESTDVKSFSLFESIGILNNEVEETKFDETMYNHEKKKLSILSGSDNVFSSETRLPQRLPGLIFTNNNSNSNNNYIDNGGIISLANVSTSASKALFSFFDNVEDEINSEEDPILRQVAFNKANPNTRSESSSYSKVLNIFGIQLQSTNLSSNQKNEIDDDMESNNHVGNNDRTTETTNTNNNNNNSNNSSTSFISFRILFETLIVFIKGLMGCLVTVYTETTNGFGAPLRRWNNISSHLRRGSPHSGSGSGSRDVTSDSNNTEVHQWYQKFVLIYLYFYLCYCHVSVLVHIYKPILFFYLFFLCFYVSFYLSLLISFFLSVLQFFLSFFLFFLLSYFHFFIFPHLQVSKSYFFNLFFRRRIDKLFESGKYYFSFGNT